MDIHEAQRLHDIGDYTASRAAYEILINEGTSALIEAKSKWLKTHDLLMNWVDLYQDTTDSIVREAISPESMGYIANELANYKWSDSVI